MASKVSLSVLPVELLVHVLRLGAPHPKHLAFFAASCRAFAEAARMFVGTFRLPRALPGFSAWDTYGVFDANRALRTLPSFERTFDAWTFMTRTLASYGDKTLVQCVGERLGDRTWLQTAVIRGNVADVRLLLRAGADPSEPAAFLPLFALVRYASHKGVDAMVRALLCAGANVNATDYDGRSLLSDALGNMDELGSDVIVTLLEFGADPRGNGDVETMAPLNIAITYNAPLALLELMIDKGADVNERSSRDTSPLECTLYALYDMADTVDVLKLLLCCGADPNDRDERGRAILHHVARIRWCRTLTTIVKLLLAYGADPRATDNDGNTPLEAAANANMLEDLTLKAFKKAGYAGAAECAERGRAKYQACLDFDE